MAFIDKHPNGTSVVIKGRPDQVSEVEIALGPQGLGASEDIGVGVGPGTVPRRHYANHQSQGWQRANDLAEAIKQLMESMGRPGVKVLRPGGPSTPPPMIPPSPADPRKGDPAKPALPGDKDKKGAIEPGAIKAYGLGVRDLDTSRMLVMNEQLVDPSEKKKTEDAGVVITAVGDKIIITGSDAKAVALAHDLARMILNTKGDTYEVYRLINANAIDAARVLNDWFNPPQQPQQNRNNNPFAAFQLGRPGGAFGAPPAAPAPDEKPRVRIVAEQSSNSLLIRANALDLITIKNMLKTVIDVGAGDSKAVVKQFYIKPLKYAVATEVVDIIKQVYREFTNQAASQGGTSGGFAFGGPFGGGFGGGRQQPLDALGNPKQVS